jgi:hypothetical protein
MEMNTAQNTMSIAQGDSGKGAFELQHTTDTKIEKQQHTSSGFNGKAWWSVEMGAFSFAM